MVINTSQDEIPCSGPCLEWKEESKEIRQEIQAKGEGLLTLYSLRSNCLKYEMSKNGETETETAR